MRNSLAILLLILPAAPAADWPSWRGPNGDAISRDGNVPLAWSATENVAWKVPVPGVGHSSPVIARGRIYLTSFLADSNDRVVICFDARDGKKLWQQTAATAAAEKMHKNNSPASATPVTDGDCVWAAFAVDGKIAVVCFDASGVRKWTRSFDGFVSPHGFCGSPILADGLLIVNGDSDGEAAFVAALDPKTGEVKWTTPRPNRTRSFSVPLLVEAAGRRQLVLAGSKSIAAYEPRTGKQIWIVDSATDKFVATVAQADGVLLATGTSPASTVTAIRPDGTGNVTKSHVLWTDAKGASYVPSPVGFGKRFLIVNDTGIATLYDAKTGKKSWSERLGRHHDASPLWIDGKLFCLADDGTTYVLAAGDEFEVLAKNAIGEDCHATPAVADGRLYVRSARHLWCLAQK